MLYIEKTTDKNYPFTICGGWGDKVYTTEEELRKLAETIIEMFAEKEVTKMVKIKDIDECRILFDNGDTITFYHCADCCEWNYADFQQIDDIARGWNFDENKMVFEAVDGCGFRFGNLPNKMVFVPCYSDQNGYYSSDVDIYYKNKQVLNLECEMI